MSTVRDSGETVVGTPALAIGVTGHRTLDDATAVDRQIVVAIDILAHRFESETGAAPPLLVVSALAEGADRMVAERVLDVAGATLEVILPLEPAEYANDFESPESKQQFAALLARATDVRQIVGTLSRDKAYEAAGRAVVDRCDVLIAVYEGERSRGIGGTRVTMEYAHSRGVPVVEVGSTPPFEINDRSLPEPLDPAKTEAKRKDYRDQRVSAQKISRHATAQRGRWLPTDRPDLAGLELDDLVAWSLTEFPRADLLATRYQRRHDWASRLLFALPVVAVATVALQLFLAPHAPRWALIEVAALLLIVVVLLWTRHRRYHDKWISCRFLAERLRSAYFLAVAATRDQRRRAETDTYFSDPADDWIKKILEEHSARRPDVVQTDVAEVRRYLAQYWIEDQTAYFCRACRKNHWWETVMRTSTLVLFVGAVGVATIHSVGPKHADTSAWSRESVIIQLSILIPVVGAAIHGLRGLREHRRHAERYRRMVSLLRVLRRRMYAAEDLATVQSIARDVEHVTRDENNDWFGVMRFHDIELIT